MRNEDQQTSENTGLVDAFFHDVMANLGIMESSMSVRLTPRFAAFLEYSGLILSIIALSFYLGMLAMHREPTALEKTIHRIELRSQLIAEEKKLEKEISHKNAIARNKGDVESVAKE